MSDKQTHQIVPIPNATSTKKQPTLIKLIKTANGFIFSNGKMFLINNTSAKRVISGLNLKPVKINQPLGKHFQDPIETNNFNWSEPKKPKLTGKY